MKAVCVIDGQGGGAVTHVLELAGGLAGKGIHTEIVFFSPGPALEEAGKRGIAWTLLPKREWRLAEFLWRLAKHVQRSGAALIHSHTINANLFARGVGRFTGIPVLTTVHSYIIDEMKGLTEPTPADHLRYRLDLYLSRWSKAVVAISDGIRDRLVENGVSAAKVAVIPNGIDLARFAPSLPTQLSSARAACGLAEGEQAVAIVARLVPLKDHRTFLSAARIVAGTLARVKFLVIGDGPLRSELERYAGELGITERVVFMGWRRDVEEILRAVDFSVLCSRTEGHGIATLEAMACGKPVIGSDVREINRTIIHGQTGLLFPVGDPEALARAMLELLQRPQEVRSMGERARSYVEDRYSIELMVNQYVDLYLQLGTAVKGRCA